MGLDASMEPDEDRDPEGQVDDFDELIRCAQSLPPYQLASAPERRCN